MTQRSRTSGSFVTLPAADVWSLGNGCSQTSWTKTGSIATRKSGEVKTMVDTVTPNYHKRRQRGDVIMNPMYSTRQLVTGFSGQGFHIKSKSTSCASPLLYHEYKVEGDYFASKLCGGNTIDPVSLFTMEEEIALMEETSTCMLSKRGRSDSNLWETLAELHKAASLFSNLARRSRKFLDFTEANGSWSNEWLAYRYGLRPIISDAEGIIKGLQKAVGDVRSTTRCQRSLQRDVSTNMYYDHDYVRDNYKRTSKHVLTVRAMSIDEYSAEVMSNIGFTTKGLLTLQWELIPYSFVADWFINVGEFINAIVPAFGYRQLGSCLVVKHLMHTEWLCTGTTEVSGTYSVVRPTTGFISSELETTRRQGVTSPSLVIKSDFGLDKLTRVGDAFALIGQQLHARFK